MPANGVSQRSCFGATFDRILYRTRVLLPGDQVTRLVDQVLLPDLLPGDVILLSSRALSACQGRLMPLGSSPPGWVARRLAAWCRRLSLDAPLAYPEAMQVAVKEEGLWPLFCSTLSLSWRRWTSMQSVGRPSSGSRGLVRVGDQQDLAVYHGQLILPPREPQQLAERLWKQTGYRTAVISVRQPGQVQVVGLSRGLSSEYIKMLVLDNPLGSKTQQTPIAILRKRK